MALTYWFEVLRVFDTNVPTYAFAGLLNVARETLLEGQRVLIFPQLFIQFHNRSCSSTMLQDEAYRQELLGDLQADCTKFFTMVENRIDALSQTKSVEQYARLQKIGQGTFGEVFKVRHKSTKQHYALKRIRMEQEKEGVRCFYFLPHSTQFPITALREIRILQSLNHENIVCLKEICHSTRKLIVPNDLVNYLTIVYLCLSQCPKWIQATILSRFRVL